MDFVGKRIGNYEIMQEIGRGGMALVYQAYDRVQRRVVALKVLPPYFEHDVQLLRRFLREGEAASRLQHPHIVRIYEAGEADGVHYMAMEYLPGGSVADALRRSGRPFDVRTAVDIITQVAAALDYAHERGVLHRDLKPSNILLDGRGRAALSDFGIAKVAGRSTLTPARALLGTVLYMSPEQARGRRDLDRRSDVYSLGIILYEMLTGRPPFQGDHDAVILRQILDDPPPRPRRLNSAIPPAVERVILSALRKDRAHRYATAGQLAAALRAALPPEPVPAVPPTVPRVEPRTAIAPAERRNRLLWPLAGALATIVLAFAIAFWPRPEPAPRGVSTPVPGATPILVPSTATSPPPTSMPTPRSYPAPALDQPENGTHAGGSSVQLIWRWKGNLEANEYFDIRIWDDENAATPRHVVWSDERDFQLDLSGLPQRFYWSIRVIRVHYEGGNRVFDGPLSPDSERRWIEWSGPPLELTATSLPPSPTPRVPAPTPAPPTLTSTPEPPTPTPAFLPSVVGRAGGVNVRSGPGTAYPLLAILEEGQQFDIVGRNPAGDWWQICCLAGEQGWVYARLVDTAGATGAVAVVANIPTPPPKPTDTPIPYSYPAPTLAQPENGTHVSASSVQLIWEWEGNLEANEYFDIRIWDDESAATPRHVVWSDRRDFQLDFSGLPTRFYWSVRVIRVHYEGGNRVFDGALSADSERRWIERPGPP